MSNEVALFSDSNVSINEVGISVFGSLPAHSGCLPNLNCLLCCEGDLSLIVSELKKLKTGFEDNSSVNLMI